MSFKQPEPKSTKSNHQKSHERFMMLFAIPVAAFTLVPAAAVGSFIHDYATDQGAFQDFDTNNVMVEAASSDRFTDQVISSIKHQSLQHGAESFNQLTDVQQQELLEINEIMHNNAEGVLKDYLAPDLYEQENHGKAVEMMNNLTPAELEQVGIDIQKLIASMPEVQDRMIMLQNSIAENGVNSIGVDGKVLPADKEAGVGATLTTTIGDNIKMTTKPMATR